MNKKRKMFPSYTLLEMLLVMAIFIVLGALGVGGYIGTKETITARENVQRIIQDIQSAKSKAMLLEKGSDENWIYGIGIDFRDTDENTETGNYKFFKWCSAFPNFGDEMTKSELLSYREGENVGFPISSETRNWQSCFAQYLNGVLPLCYTNACVSDFPSLVAIKGDDLSLLDKEVGKMIVLDVDDDNKFAAFLVFEAITGRAFLYNRYGWSYSYNLSGEYNNNYNVLDIVLPRKYSSKFDLITIYPLSGTVIHHVYSSSDFKSGDCVNGDVHCITYKDKSYKRYGISEEINSYRD